MFKHNPYPVLTAFIIGVFLWVFFNNAIFDVSHLFPVGEENIVFKRDLDTSHLQRLKEHNIRYITIDSRDTLAYSTSPKDKNYSCFVAFMSAANCMVSNVKDFPLTFKIDDNGIHYYGKTLSRRETLTYDKELAIRQQVLDQVIADAKAKESWQGKSTSH